MKHPISLSAAVVLVGLAACQKNKEAPATNEPSEAPTPEAVTPTSRPEAATGPNVGTAGKDATAAPPRGDTASAAGSHP